MKTLLIIESPNKIHTIDSIFRANKSAFLPLLNVDSLNDVKIVATIGHFVDLNLDNGNKGFKIMGQNVYPDWKFAPDKLPKLNSNLVPELEAADTILLGSDDDREGERIASEVLMLIDKRKISTAGKQIYRIRTSEITERGFLKSLSHKTTGLNNNTVNASVARLLTDLEYGYTISTWGRNVIKESIEKAPDEKTKLERLAFVSTYKNEIQHFAAGRVKSFALDQIGLRCDEIKNYVEKNWFTINPLVHTVLFSQFATNLPGTNLVSGTVQYLDKQNAENALRQIGANFKVDNVADLAHTVQAKAKPLILPDIPSKNLSNGSATKQLCAQEIYEAGLSTYPRTENRYVSVDFLEQAVPAWGEMLAKIPNLNGEVWAVKPDEKYINDGTKDAAHECYRVVDITLNAYEFTRAMCDHLFAAGDPKWQEVASHLAPHIQSIRQGNFQPLITADKQNAKYYLHLKDLLQLYSDLRTGTLKMLTNPPEYEKAEVQLSSQQTPSEKFKATLSQRTKQGYLFLNKGVYQIDENTVFTPSVDDDATVSDIAETHNFFKTHPTVVADNFNVTDVTNNNSIIKARKTRKPSLMSNDELVKIMTEKEIGQPSTRDGIIADITDTKTGPKGEKGKQAEKPKRGVIRIEPSKTQGNLFDLTPFGDYQYRLIREHLPNFVNADLTKTFEQQLSAIEDGKETAGRAVLAVIDDIDSSILKPYNWYTYDAKQEVRAVKSMELPDEHCPFCGAPVFTNGVYWFCRNEANCPLIKSWQAKLQTDPTLQKKYPDGIHQVVLGKIADFDFQHRCGPHNFPNRFVDEKHTKSVACPVCAKIAEKPTTYNCPFCGQPVIEREETYYCSAKCPDTAKYKGYLAKKDRLSQELCPEDNFPKLLSKDGKTTYCLNRKHWPQTAAVAGLKCPFCGGPVGLKNGNYVCLNQCPDTAQYKGYLAKAENVGTICQEHGFYQVKTKDGGFICLADWKQNKTIPQATVSKIKCPACNQPLKENAKMYFCDNPKCLTYKAEEFNKWHHNYAVYKASIVAGEFCPRHPEIPMQLSKSGKKYCAVDFVLPRQKTQLK